MNESHPIESTDLSHTSSKSKILITILSLLVFFPLGIFFMFKWMPWKAWVKWSITIIMIVYASIVLSVGFFLVSSFEKALDTSTGQAPMIDASTPEGLVESVIRDWCDANGYDECETMNVLIDGSSAFVDVRIGVGSELAHTTNITLNRMGGVWEITSRGGDEYDIAFIDIEKQKIITSLPILCSTSGYENCVVEKVEIDGEYAVAETPYRVFLLIKNDAAWWDVAYSSPYTDICKDYNESGSADLLTYCTR